jgi:hypothetical protein
MSARVVARCTVCERELTPGEGFVLAGRRRCPRCTFLHSRLLIRSLITALVVGTVLITINQGTDIVAGTIKASLAWKVPLTYLVPFLVSTWGALINGRPASGA